MLSNKDGFHTNAIYGFLNILKKLENEFKPEITVIAFDLKKPTFRHKFYSEYKATRKSMPSDLAEQIPVLKDLLTTLGYVLIEKEGYEADDILGTLAYFCEQNKKECVISTGDKDALQLISKYVSVSIASTKIKDINSSTYTENKIFNEYGIMPKQLIDVKALCGDVSDNIPGVKGIGEKTAVRLIKEYETLDRIYENIDSLDINENLKQKLILGKDSAYLSRYLGKIKTDVPIESSVLVYKSNTINKTKAKKILEKLDMFSIIKKLDLV